MSTLNCWGFSWGRGEVFSPFHFWHIKFTYYTPAAVSKEKENSFYWECQRALQCVSCNEVLSRKADFVPPTTTACSTPFKLGSHTLFSWSLCHLLIAASLQLTRYPLCIMCLTQDLQDTLWSIPQVKLDFCCFFSKQHFSSPYKTPKIWLSTLLSCSFTT